jgi:Ca2+-binding RTX toxin-like protein
MGIRNVLTRRALAGFGISALAAAVLAGVPTAAHALPNIKVDTTLNFGQVSVGDSKELNVTITNQGNSAVPEDDALNFLAQAFLIGDSRFSVVNPICAANPLDGGQSCNTITLKFTPTSTDAAVADLSLFMQYVQDTDPTAGQNFEVVQRQFTITLVGNVLCGGLTPTILGTQGDDVIAGTSGNDVIATLDGDDTVKADGGNDVVCGGGDSDLLKGGKGKDKLYGDGGSDILKGGKGTDTCVGGLGVDRAKKCEKVGSL